MLLVRRTYEQRSTRKTNFTIDTNGKKTKMKSIRTATIEKNVKEIRRIKDESESRHRTMYRRF